MMNHLPKMNRNRIGEAHMEIIESNKLFATAFPD
jgi:hypothetical protein